MKEKAEKEKATVALKAEEKERKAGSFTPSQIDDAKTTNPALAAINNNISKANSKPSSRTSRTKMLYYPFNCISVVLGAIV